MARVVMVACASHAPMMTADRHGAPPEQAQRWFGALAQIRAVARERAVDTAVVCSNEHFANFFLENFPQTCVGLAEEHWAPAEAWLNIRQRWVPGDAGLANHLVGSLLAQGFEPSTSQALRPDHGIMCVYDELFGADDVRLVPVVQNCALPPLPTLRRCVALGAALRRAVDSFPDDRRVAVIGTGGLSHWIGHPRVGDIDEAFDRWFLRHLAAGDLEPVLALTDAQLGAAGNGAHEVRSWLTAAGAAGGPAEVLVYEPVYPWINGMAACLMEPAPAR